MKARLIIAGVALSTIMSACGTSYSSRKDVRFADAMASVEVVDPTAKVEVNPERFEDTWVFQKSDIKKLGKVLPRELFERIKQEAMAKSMLKHEADIIIAPLFDFNAAASFSEVAYTVTLRGYAGRFVDWDKNAAAEKKNQPVSQQQQ